MQNLKSNLETLHKRSNDKRAQLEIAQHLSSELNKDMLNVIPLSHEFVNLATKRDIEDKVLVWMRDFMNEIFFFVKDTANELKKGGINTDDMAGCLRDMEVVIKRSKSIREKLHDFVVILLRMSETYNMTWTKEIQKLV